MKRPQRSLSVQVQNMSLSSQLRGEVTNDDENQDERFSRIIRDGTALDIRNTLLEVRRDINNNARMGRFTKNSLQLTKEFNELATAFLEKKLSLEKVENSIETLRSSVGDDDLNPAIQAALDQAIEKACELKNQCTSIPMRIIQLRERIDQQVETDKTTEKGLQETLERCLKYLPKLERGKVASTASHQTANMNIEQRLTFLARLIEQLAEKVPSIREVEISRLIEDARKKFSFHDHQAALECLKQVFQFDRKNVPAHRIRADIYKEMGNQVAYLCELRMIIKIDTAEGFDFSRLANEILNANGKKDEACQLMEKAVEKNPSPDYLEQLGDLSSQLKIWFRAIHVFQQYLKKSPKQPRIMHKLGRALLENKQEDEAFETLRTAIELQDDNSHSRVCTGRIFRKQVSPVQAEESFARAVELDEENADAYYWWGLMQFDRGDFSKALKNAKQSVKFDSSRARNRLLFARSCLAAGVPSHAAKALEPSLSGSTPAVDVLLTYSEACRTDGNLKKVLDTVGAFVKRFPHQPQLRAEYGLLLLEDGRPSEATAYFQPASFKMKKAVVASA